MSNVSLRPLDPSPPRPGHHLAPPPHRLAMTVDVDTAHLANPLLAVGRLLASEAKAFAHVEGDEDRFTITVALPDVDRDTVHTTESWIRWCVHNAGVRGTLRRTDDL